MSGKAKSGGGRKIGRHAKWCASYRARKQREKNKLRRVRRHVRGHPGDKAATDKARYLSTFLGGTGA